LTDRQEAIAAAFRSARAVPRLQSAPATPAAEPVRPPGVDPAVVDALRVEVRRLTERLERVENKVDLIGDGEEETPLAWPVEVETDNRLEVPPLEVKRSNSPAFDVLLGPPARRDAS
jgi:hypothetical protein